MEKWKRVLIGIVVVSIYIVIGTWYYASIEPRRTVFESFIWIDFFVVLWLSLFSMGIEILAMIAVFLFILGKYIGLVFWVYWSMGSATLTKKCVVGIIVIGLLIYEFILNAEWAGFIPGP